ncbi:hypothetical protein GCM10023205_68230 [Yinghuangia aomiensis]|uniref:Secreted protein n=1 Tax=Yinghuangia aomiensis TaxID=676205 RepID=A0ABP9I5C2_9ACTN
MVLPAPAAAAGIAGDAAAGSRCFISGSKTATADSATTTTRSGAPSRSRPERSRAQVSVAPGFAASAGLVRAPGRTSITIDRRHVRLLTPCKTETDDDICISVNVA